MCICVRQLVSAYESECNHVRRSKGSEEGLKQRSVPMEKEKQNKLETDSILDEGQAGQGRPVGRQAGR